MVPSNESPIPSYKLVIADRTSPTTQIRGPLSVHSNPHFLKVEGVALRAG